MLPFLLLLFPTGRVPSREWRQVGWIAGAAAALMLVSAALFPGPLFGAPYAPSNPIGVGDDATMTGLYFLGLTFDLIAVVAAIAAVVVRFRAAQGQERQQLKWCLYGAAILVAALIVVTPLEAVPGTAIALAGIVAFTACVVVAMLRHQLYDIDRLITRTLRPPRDHAGRPSAIDNYQAVAERACGVQPPGVRAPSGWR